MNQATFNEIEHAFLDWKEEGRAEVLACENYESHVGQLLNEVTALKADIAFRARIERTEAEGIKQTLVGVLSSELVDTSRCVTDTGKDWAEEHNEFLHKIGRRLGITLKPNVQCPTPAADSRD